VVGLGDVFDKPSREKGGESEFRKNYKIAVGGLCLTQEIDQALDNA
jgi:hypothetical protein